MLKSPDTIRPDEPPALPQLSGGDTPLWALSQIGRTVTLRLQGNWSIHDFRMPDGSELRSLLDKTNASVLRVDAAEIGKWDSTLIAFVKLLRETASAQAGRATEVDLSELPEAVQRLLRLAAVDQGGSHHPKRGSPSIPTRVGEATLAVASEVTAFAALLGELVLRTEATLRFRTCTRLTDVLTLMRQAGAGTLGVVAIINVLIGAILAFVGAVELQRLGAGLYVANLVGIAVVREMAAIATAIVVAGRTGGSYAAHLATMQGNEEIDALRVVGISPFDFLVLPRVVALVAMMPLLYLYGCAAGLFGGFVVGVMTLGLPPLSFSNEMQAAVNGTQFALGLLKSVVFGLFIAIVGCRQGLRTGRSAADVGAATTKAVVIGIIGVIAIDAVFAVCANALGI